MIETALHEGRLNLGDAIVEATAGNTGIGLAIAANRFNINCKIFAPDGFQKKRLLLCAR